MNKADFLAAPVELSSLTKTLIRKLVEQARDEQVGIPITDRGQACGTFISPADTQSLALLKQLMSVEEGVAVLHRAVDEVLRPRVAKSPAAEATAVTPAVSTPVRPAPDQESDQPMVTKWPGIDP